MNYYYKQSLSQEKKRILDLKIGDNIKLISKPNFTGKIIDKKSGTFIIDLDWKLANGKSAKAYINDPKNIVKYKRPKPKFVQKFKPEKPINKKLYKKLNAYKIARLMYLNKKIYKPRYF